MARKLRVEYAGAIYHVMNRGDRRELIFMDDGDRQRFVETLGEELAETAEALAELIIAEELKRGRWQEAELKIRPKGDPVKVALAARLRAETTMTVGWIAERLAMGTRGYLNYLLYRRRKLDGE